MPKKEWTIFFAVGFVAAAIVICTPLGSYIPSWAIVVSASCSLYIAAATNFGTSASKAPRTMTVMSGLAGGGVLWLLAVYVCLIFQIKPPHFLL
jgi:hypothetical protein